MEQRRTLKYIFSWMRFLEVSIEEVMGLVKDWVWMAGEVGCVFRDEQSLVSFILN